MGREMRKGRKNKTESGSDPFASLVFAACAKIPRGKVSTYSDLARAISHPYAARAVGNTLNKNRSRFVPCHRVVRSDGCIGGFAHGTEKKIEMLRHEGVDVMANLANDGEEKVDLKRFLFKFR